MFRIRRGTPLGAKQVSTIGRKAAGVAAAGRKVTPHWLRHCNASHALDNGAPIHVVVASLGHKPIMTTRRHLHAKPGVSTGASAPGRTSGGEIRRLAIGGHPGVPIARPRLIAQCLGEAGQGGPVGEVPGGEAQHPPPQEGGTVHLFMVGRESGSPGMPAATGHPCAAVELDREHPSGPGEIETPATAELPGEFVFGHRFREPRRPDHDEETQLQW